MLDRTRSLVVSLALSLAACGPAPAMTDGGHTGNDAGTDPLIGSWFVQVTVSDNQTETLTFDTDGTLTSVHSQDDSPTSADHAGCTETLTDHGGYVEGMAGAMRTLDVTWNLAQSGQIAYTNCTNPADNGTALGSPLLPAGQWTYSVQGDTLMLVPGGAGSETTLMRQ